MPDLQRYSITKPFNVLPDGHLQSIEQLNVSIISIMLMLYQPKVHWTARKVCIDRESKFIVFHERSDLLRSVELV